VGNIIRIKDLSAQSTSKNKGHYAFSVSTGIAMAGGMPTTTGSSKAATSGAKVGIKFRP
jgi:hypothetical protein